MVTTYLQGGLGNFMFQIAAATSLSRFNNDHCAFSADRVLVIHNPISHYQNNVLRNVRFILGMPDITTTYTETGFEYNEIPYQKDLMLIGYFQSEKYFDKKLISDMYSIPQNIENKLKTKYGEVLDDNTCSIHIRHGDYIGIQDHHPLCSLEYYNNAMSKMPSDTKFLIFSDDINWCKENFTGDQFIFTDNDADYEDLYLMSICKNNIIANSSFSWWGAWLNKNPDKIVIAPKTWFGSSKSNLNLKDFIPETWIQLN